MKKFFMLLTVVFILCFMFASCSDTKTDETSSSTTEKVVESTSVTETTTKNIFEPTVTAQNPSTTVTQSTTETTTEKQTQTTVFDDNTTTTTTTKKYQSNPLVSDEDMEKIENSNAEVYFTDNPENKYIIAIADKYGSKKENLVALVKVNAEFPSVYVFEFSGKKDSNGELVMTYEELKFVYEINETQNTIVRASKSGFDNDGVNFMEAKVLVALAKEYFIPELPNLKANKKLPE